MSKATSEVLERWNFNIVTDAEVVEKGCATRSYPPSSPSSCDPSQSKVAAAHCVSHGLIVRLLLMFVRAIKEKSDKEIMREIQAIMRQIASCITYLPCLDEPCKDSNRHPIAELIFLSCISPSFWNWGCTASLQLQPWLTLVSCPPASG
jgi:hypothetical protein